MKKKEETPMKKKEEPNATKEEIKTENNQPRKLTEEELEQVTGGDSDNLCCTIHPTIILVNGFCPVCSALSQQSQQSQQPLMPNQCPTCRRVLLGGHCAKCGY